MQARFRLVALAICVIVLGAALAPPLDVRAQSDVQFAGMTATADFPRSITFALTATTPAGVESVELYWRTAGSLAYTLSEADVAPGETIDATVTADTAIRYLPPGVDVEYFWRVTDASGNVHDSPHQTLVYMDQRFDWQTIQAGLVSVWWYQGSVEYAEEIAHTANRTLVTLETEFGIVSDVPLRIIVYGNDRDFSTALRPNSAEWIGGVAYSSLGHIVAHIRPGGNAGREINRMIPHEVSHVAVHAASRNPYNAPPPWLDEGLATYVQYVEDQRLRPTLDRAVRDGRLIPIGALKSSFPLDPDQALLSYAESLSIVTYLVETYGERAVGELVTIYVSEVSHDQAVREVLGISIEELDRDWKEWLGYGGDRHPGAGSAATSLGLPNTFWYATVLFLAGLATTGLVVFLIWRTRSYAESDLDDDERDSSPASG